MSYVIGIDLGTTNSCVSVLQGGTSLIIPNAEGNRTTPSVVAFTAAGERLVGEPAKRQAAVNVNRTISSIKRHMGTDYRMRIDGKEYTPQEISAMILLKLKKDAEAFLGEKVTEAVITVPAYFNDGQRQATKDAGRIAGLNVRRIINEPTSAALAYGLDNGQDQKILVYDLGGGTFDVSVIEIGDNVIEVLATAGNNRLGGDDFDMRLASHIAQEFKRTEKIDLSRDPVARQRILEAAEKAKKELSASTTTSITLPFICQDKAGGMKNLDMTISRALFEQLTADLIDATAQPVQQALADAGISARELNRVILVGGSTRMPAVLEKVRRLTGLEPSRNVNPDECVAMGAAIQGQKLSGELIVGSAAAANDIILMDVTPLSLSIETIGGVANRIIERNSPIPTRKSKIFTTAANFQTSVDIKIYQGERRFTRDNKLLGNFQLTGIKRARAGVPQIEVTFDLDENGILKVTAKDLGTGKNQQITVTSSTNMSEAEIERARRDAERYENGMDAREELMQIRNDAESLAFRVESLLGSEGKALGMKEKARIKADLHNLKKLLGKTPADKMTETDAGFIQNAAEMLRSSTETLLAR